MGVGKSLGRFAGTVAGSVIRVGTDIVGGVTGSEFIKEVGESAMKATIRTGETVGRAADGLGGTVRGYATGDERMAKAGIAEAGGAVADTARGVVSGVCAVAKDGKTVYHGVKTGDMVAVKDAGRNIAKAVAVSVIAVGVLDVLDVVDIGVEGPDGFDDHVAMAEADDVDANAFANAENAHMVHPHWVGGYVTEDGTEVGPVWRDGPNAPDIDAPNVGGGVYWAGNPDGDLTNNLRPT